MKTALLPHEKTLQLINEAQRGDALAQETLVENNIALVKSIIKKFLGRGVEYDDLYQLGCIGLVKAIQNFEPDFNVRFSTYAVPMIAGEIKRFLRDDGMIKVSRSLREISAKAAAAAEAFMHETGREPTLSEISERTGVSVEDLLMALESARTHLSLDAPSYDEDSAPLGDLVADTPQQDALIDKLLLKELIGKLDARERQIIMLRYFSDKTQGQIAQMLGVSQVQVSRLESKIIKKLRNYATG